MRGGWALGVGLTVGAGLLLAIAGCLGSATLRTDSATAAGELEDWLRESTTTDWNAGQHYDWQKGDFVDASGKPIDPRHEPPKYVVSPPVVTGLSGFAGEADAEALDKAFDVRNYPAHPDAGELPGMAAIAAFAGDTRTDGLLTAWRATMDAQWGAGREDAWAAHRDEQGWSWASWEYSRAVTGVCAGHPHPAVLASGRAVAAARATPEVQEYLGQHPAAALLLRLDLGNSRDAADDCDHPPKWSLRWMDLRPLENRQPSPYLETVVHATTGDLLSVHRAILRPNGDYVPVQVLEAVDSIAAQPAVREWAFDVPAGQVSLLASAGSLNVPPLPEANLTAYRLVAPDGTPIPLRNMGPAQRGDVLHPMAGTWRIVRDAGPLLDQGPLMRVLRAQVMG